MPALFGSAWLWWLAGALLWAYIGVLAASASTIPLAVGAVAGAVTWFVGVIVILLLGPRYRQGTRPLRAAQEVPLEVPLGVPQRFVPLFDDDEQSLGPSAGPSAGSSAQSSARSDAFAVWPAALLVVAVIGGSATALSAFLPWGSGSASWGTESASSVDIGWSPADFGPAATLIVVSGLAVAALGVLARRRLRGRWLAVGMMIAAGWFTLGLQVFISVSGTAQLSQVAAAASQDVVSAAISTGSGLWLLCIGAGSVLVWGVLSATQLLMERNRL